MKFGPALLAVLALTGCAPDAAKVEAELEQLVRSYVTSTDIAASVNMMDAAPTVTSITSQGRIVRGRDVIKDEPSKQITRLSQLKVTAGKIEVTLLGATHALAIAPFTVGPSATPEVSTTQGTATLLLAKRDSGWKVMHEHFSATGTQR